MTEANSRKSWRTILKRMLWILVLAVGAVYAAFQISPWPMVMVIRYTFGKGAQEASAALVKHLPVGVRQMTDLAYLPDEPRARLDVFTPSHSTPGAFPTIVWIHGGAWVSGSKNDIRNYARILAGHGYTVVTVGYDIAPERRYPTPVRQTHAALAYLRTNARKLHINPNHLVLAGDSAGAHIAAQTAATAIDPAYARAVGVQPGVRPGQIKGMLLYCGPYDTAAVNTEGAFGGFLKAVLWAYSGQRDFRTAREFQSSAVLAHVTHNFPPTFISAGNADPLLPQSLMMADRLEAKGVRVQRLFFPVGYQPALGHEYQFNLDGEAGRLALMRSLAFLQSLEQ